MSSTVSLWPRCSIEQLGAALHRQGAGLAHIRGVVDLSCGDLDVEREGLVHKLGRFNQPSPLYFLTIWPCGLAKRRHGGDARCPVTARQAGMPPSPPTAVRPTPQGEHRHGGLREAARGGECLKPSTPWPSVTVRPSTIFAEDRAKQNQVGAPRSRGRMRPRPDVWQLTLTTQRGRAGDCKHLPGLRWDG